MLAEWTGRRVSRRQKLTEQLRPASAVSCVITDADHQVEASDLEGSKGQIATDAGAAPGAAAKVCQDGAVTSGISGPAREFVRATVAAVDLAADGSDPEAYDSAIARLAAHPDGGRVLGDLLRALLEDTHPEGFDSDDVAVVTGRCHATAVAWLPPERVDVSTLLIVLAGALGIHPYVDAEQPRDQDDAREETAPTWPNHAWHAPLLIAGLLPYAPATLDAYLAAVFAEYAREAREEQP